MRLLCIFVLSIFAVFKSHARNIERDGNPEAIQCDKFIPSELTSAPTPWKSNYIFPVLACTKLNGIISACDHSNHSEIHLTFFTGRRYFDLASYLHPKDFYASKMTHCRLFHASEFATKLKDQSIADSFYSLRSSIHGNPEGATTPTFQVTARALTYHTCQPKHNIEATPSDDRTVHAVICGFPNCTVVAEGYSATRTEFFTINEGKTPLHEERGGPVTKGMFSVTSFECEPGKCPTKFSALNLTEPATKTALKNCLDKCIP